MAEVFYPFDSGAGASVTEVQWYKMASLWAADGVALKFGGGLPYGDSSGLQIKVPVMTAYVGGHYYNNDAIKTISVAANSTGATRLDRVVLRADRTANTVAAVVLTGTTSLPNISQTDSTWDVTLAKISVANGAATITAANVTDDRQVSTGIDGAGGHVIKLGENHLLTPSTTLGDFIAIPSGFRHLDLVTTGRVSVVALESGYYFQINALGGTTYYNQGVTTSGTAVTASRGSGVPQGRIGGLPGASAAANQIGAYTTRFYNYSIPTFNRLAVSVGGRDLGGQPITEHVSCTAVTTQAVNRINIAEDTGGQFAAESRAVLYGIR